MAPYTDIYSTYCDAMSTWATPYDLYARYGDEFIDKLSIRRVFDVTLDDYVADESEEGKLKVLNLALCDSMVLLNQKLACCFSNISILNEYSFPTVKQWHIRMAIEILRQGGDCSKCSGCQTEFFDWCKCASICSDDGVCLSSNGTFMEASTAVFCCEEYLRGCSCNC